MLRIGVGTENAGIMDCHVHQLVEFARPQTVGMLLTLMGMTVAYKL